MMDRQLVYCVITYKNVKHAVELHEWHLRKYPIEYWGIKNALDVVIPFKGAFVTLFIMHDHKRISDHFPTWHNWKSATARYYSPDDISELDMSEFVRNYKPRHKRRRRSII